MSQIPTQIPPTPFSREDLREIASRQKALLLCLLLYLVGVVCQFVVPAVLGIFLGLGMLAVIVASTVFVFMLAIKLYGTGTGVVLGILTLIPLVGLIILLVVNGRATKVLTSHGVSIGLLGARGPIN